MDLTKKLRFGVTLKANKPHFSVIRKGSPMSDQRLRRTNEEWLSLIQQCRKSGMTDAQWCLNNGISRHTFYNAVKRLRKCSYEVPSRRPRDIYDLTSAKQDVVKVDIIPDVLPPKEALPEMAPHFDNSHMIEIRIGDVHISLSNGADPVLVSSTLSLLRSCS